MQLSSGGLDGPAQIPAVVELRDCHGLKGGPQVILPPMGKDLGSYFLNNPKEKGFT